MATFKSVEEYLDSVPAESRKTLEAVRRAIHKAVPEAEECISYCMPGFRLKKVLVTFGAFKNHCSFFPMSLRVIDQLKDDLEGIEVDKGTIRFPIGQPLPDEIVAKIVLARVREVSG